MRGVVDQYEPDGDVPFAMGFMQEPDADDHLYASGNTYTTVYTTRCGPTSAPDDGAVTHKDD